MIRPVENAPILTIVIVTLGLLVILNSMAGWIYSYIQKPFPSPFPGKPIRIGNIVFGAHDLGEIGVTLVVLALLFALLPLHARSASPCARPRRTRCRAGSAGSA